MASRIDLKPSSKELVIDLVARAGVDVSDWSNYSGGPSKASTNPNYCYGWSFVQPNSVVVLSLWYENVAEVDGEIRYNLNVRADARTERTPQQKRRAIALDEALKTAIKDRLPIKVIINDGAMRVPTSQRPSRVLTRALDSELWSIESYDNATGDCRLFRGISVVDQFDVGATEDSPTETKIVTTIVYHRDADIRQKALTRSQGCCEFCGQRGFPRADGGYFLETHHVVPLSEGGKDGVSNVAALCPNHHREAHHGAKAAEIRFMLLSKLKSLG